MPPQTDLVGDPILIPTARFELLSPDLLRAYESADGRKMIHGVASSTTKDLHGDTILRSALEDMERAAPGMTIFRNHSYIVPDDVAGSVEKAGIKTEGVDQDGDPNHSLHFDIEVEDEQPEAVRTWKMVKKGRKLGLSIGAMIPPGGARKQKDGSLIIDHIQLLETSIVGIPANPKSWVQTAKSALDLAIKGKTTELGNPTLTLEGDKYKIEGSLQGLDLNLGERAVPLNKDGEPLTEPEVDWNFAWDRENKVQISRSVTTPVENGMVEMDQTVLGSWDLTDPDDKLAAIAIAGEEAVTKATVWVETRDGDKITIGEPVEETASVSADTDPVTTADAEPEVANASCPSCGKGKGSTGCDDSYHKDTEPDVTDAKVRIIEVDTDSPESGGGQGASSSEPDDADTLSASPDAGTEPVILDGMTEGQLIQMSFDQLQAAALAALRALDEQKRLLGEEKTARAEAERQRDEVLEAAAELLTRQAAFVEKVANSPLTRKATAREVREHSASIEAFYGEEFARVLTAPSVRS